MKIRHIILSLLSSVLLTFSFPNFIQQTVEINTYLLAWVAFIPLFIVLIEEERPKMAFIYGMISVSAFYYMSMYWMCFVGPMGVFAYVACFILCTYFGFVYGLALFTAKKLHSRSGISIVFSLPFIVVFTEYIREWLFSGCPMLTPAQSQQQFTQFFLLASITGAHGLNFLLVSVNMAAAWIIVKKKIDFAKKENTAWIITFLLVVAMAVAANFRPAPGPVRLKVALIQPNIDQNMPWTESYKKATMAIMKKMITGISGEKPGLVVWPETGFPGILNVEPAAAKEIASWSPGSYNLIGSDRMLIDSVNKPNYYNSAFLVSPSGAIIADYSKYHLVPFGEYIPLADVFPFVKKVVQRYGYSGFSRGVKIEPMQMGDIKIGAAICYDALFPEISREFVKKGVRVLAHLSYETWYGVSASSAQVSTNVALRAVENGIYVVRDVASGISGIIDDSGRIVSHTKLFERDAVVYEIKLPVKSGTIYTKFGDWFAWVCALAIAVFIFLNRKNNADPHK